MYYVEEIKYCQRKVQLSVKLLVKKQRTLLKLLFSVIVLKMKWISY